MITDSFHGTAFSINLEVPFYSINNGRDQRKRLLLKNVGLESQLISSINDLVQKDNTIENIIINGKDKIHIYNPVFKVLI